MQSPTQVEECWLITGGGIHVKLEPSLDGPTAIHATYMPRHTERTMHTRSSNDRRQRTMQEVTVQYNLVNEPWHKYSISNIAGVLVKRGVGMCSTPQACVSHSPQIMD